MRTYDQERPEPPVEHKSWMAQGEPSRWTRLRWVIVLTVVGFFLAMLALALTDEGNAAAKRGSACFKTTGTGAVETLLGTDMVRGHTTGFWCDHGSYLNLGGVRTRAETTTLGEIGFWRGIELNKGVNCPSGTNSHCRFGVWWGKYKAIQDPPGNVPSNTEYLRVRVRCNYQRECKQARRNWGRAPHPMSEPSESTDVWTNLWGGGHSLIWNAPLPTR